jgi:hypothetical protein
MVDFNAVYALPNFDAETKFPYGSKACPSVEVLGHNLIHRICEEVDKLLVYPHA